MRRETSIVQDLIKDLLHDLKENHIMHVAEIRLQRASTFSEEVLRETFDTLIQGTSLQDCKLRIETINIMHECCYGHKQIITSDDFDGQMFICPVCGGVQKIEPACELELLKVIPAPQAHVSIVV